MEIQLCGHVRQNLVHRNIETHALASEATQRLACDRPRVQLGLGVVAGTAHSVFRTKIPYHFFKHPE